VSDFAARWDELERWLDRALDLEPERRAAWIAQQPLAPELREALLQAIARAEAPGELDRLHRAIAGASEGPDWIGRRVGAFRIERLLGEGGSASVYLAEREQAGFRQRVALKLLRQGLFRADDRALFERERRILAMLDHPHIARLIDGGVTDNGVPYIAMEYVDGEPITRHCDRQRMSVAPRIALFAEVCDVVAYAQRNLVVHRDLKPSNILVARDGTLKLLDFGIAKLLDVEADAARTATAMVRLTPGYAAPEQFAGGPVTTATDVHALGVLLHELLVGARPRLDANGACVLPSARTQEGDSAARACARATTPRALRQALRGDLDTVLASALAPEASMRYADAAALGADLRRYLAAEPIHARPATIRYRVGKFVERHRGGVVAASLFLLALFAASGAALWQARVARREAQRASSVRDFLLGVFDAARANLPSNERPSPARLVDLAVQRARADGTLPADLRADFLRVAGRVSASLDEYAQADSELDEALRLFDRAGVAATAPERLDALATKAELLRDTDRNADADRLLAAHLPQLRRRESPEAARALLAYASTRLQADHADDAVALAREGADMAARVLPRGTRAAFASASFPGQILSAAGRDREAIAVLEPVLAEWRTSGVPLDIDYAQALNDLAVAMDRSGDGARALPLYEEGIALRRRIFAGKPNDKLASALSSYANVLTRHDRFDEARALLEEALAIDREVLGPDSLQVADVLDTRGWLEAYLWRLDDAERYIRQSLAIYEANVGQAGHADELRIVRQHLIQVLLDAERADEAASLNAVALAELRAANDTVSPAYFVTQNFQARIELAHGQTAQALARSQDLLRLVSSPAFTHRRMQIIAHRLRASALAAAHREPEALAEIDAALRLAQSLTPDAHSSIAALLLARARLQRATGDVQGAAATVAAARNLRVPVARLSPQDRATLGAG
jgi:serine/threonine-protein kinase